MLASHSTRSKLVCLLCRPAQSEQTQQQLLVLAVVLLMIRLLLLAVGVMTSQRHLQLKCRAGQQPPLQLLRT
jgi:hypothetical protein